MAASVEPDRAPTRAAHPLSRGCAGPTHSAGRHRHIRMYKLEDIFGEGRYTGAFSRKEPFVKLKNTKFCAHYTTGMQHSLKTGGRARALIRERARSGRVAVVAVRVRGTTFLVAAVKTAVILFMWAEFPFNQFMKIKVRCGWGCFPPVCVCMVAHAR